MGFEFRDLNVYKKALTYKKAVNRVIMETKPDKDVKDQFKRAATSIILNIAEGFGKYHSQDKKRYYLQARGSINECVACLDIIYEEKPPEKLLEESEEIAKMLTGLINRFNKGKEK